MCHRRARARRGRDRLGGRGRAFFEVESHAGALGELPCQKPVGDGPHQGIGRGLGLGRVVDRLRRRRVLLRVRVWSCLDRRGLLFDLVRAEPADVGQDLVQAVTGDVLHGVVADAVVLAVVEDRDDIGVVQLGRRAGFVMEPPEVVGAGAEPWVHDLERHAAA